MRLFISKSLIWAIIYCLLPAAWAAVVADDTASDSSYTSHESLDSVWERPPRELNHPAESAFVACFGDSELGPPAVDLFHALFQHAKDSTLSKPAPLFSWSEPDDAWVAIEDSRVHYDYQVFLEPTNKELGKLAFLKEWAASPSISAPIAESIRIILEEGDEVISPPFILHTLSVDGVPEIVSLWTTRYKLCEDSCVPYWYCQYIVASPRCNEGELKGTAQNLLFKMFSEFDGDGFFKWGHSKDVGISLDTDVLPMAIAAIRVGMDYKEPGLSDRISYRGSHADKLVELADSWGSFASWVHTGEVPENESETGSVGSGAGVAGAGVP